MKLSTLVRSFLPAALVAFIVPALHAQSSDPQPQPALVVQAPDAAPQAASSSAVQAPPARTAAPPPPLRRWFEFQQLTLYSRYRYVDNSSGVTTANQLQYKDSIRARFNIDEKKRYTVNVGVFTGTNFTGTWNNYGIGTGGNFVGKQYLKQLYASAAPIDGLELQYGGIYIIRGENDEWTSYDDDGYLAGERVSLRRPKEAYFDEISVTRAAIGPYSTPALGARLDGFSHPNYWQVLVDKKFSRMLAGSLDYTTQSGADTLRAAVTIHLPAHAPVNTIRYEQYKRVTMKPAAGFGLWADRAISKYLRLQGGYVTIDEFYGPTDTARSSREWNADRMQRGRRLFAAATIPIYGPLSASIYATHAFDSPFSVTIHNRLDTVIQYDVLDSLHRTGVF